MKFHIEIEKSIHELQIKREKSSCNLYMIHITYEQYVVC